MHFKRGHDYARAINYLELAGKNSIRLNAYTEAVSHLGEGIDLIGKLPNSKEQGLKEIALRNALGVALMASKGFAATEVGENYARARELCQALGENHSLFTSMWGLWQSNQINKVANYPTETYGLCE